MRKARVVTIAIGIALVPLLSGTAVRASANDMVMLSVAKDPIKFADSSVIEVTGIHVDGGCRWTVNQLRAPGEARVGAQEIGRDTVNCIELVRVGHIVQSTDPVGPSSGTDPCDDEYFGWYDPLGVRLTFVDTGGCFAYTGTYVGNCSVWYNNKGQDTQTGWHLGTTSGPSVYTDTSNRQCYAYYNAYFWHGANVFCPAGTTYTEYYSNELVMYGNGSTGSGTTSWAAGQCPNLLHWWSNH